MSVEDGPPNFFCRLPAADSNNTKKIDRSASPPPLAFLQHILNSYQPEQEQEAAAAVTARPRRTDGLVDDGRGSRSDVSSAGRSAAVEYNSSNTTNALRHPSQRQDTAASSSSSGHGSSANSTVADDDGKSEEDDAPWFSQLANLPQVRSAGIPLVAPASSSSSSSTTSGARSAAHRPRHSQHHHHQQQQSSMKASLDPAGPSSVPSSSFSTSSNSNTNNRSTMEQNSSSGSLLQPSSLSSSSSLSDAVSDSMSSSLASLNMDGLNSLSKASLGNDSKAKTTASAMMPSPPVPPSRPQFSSAATATQATTTATATSAAAAAAGATTSTTTSTSSAPLVPPENFAMVNSWVYRSSFPKKRHFPFLKTLGLKSVLTLILEEYPEQNTRFLDENGITFFQFGIPGNKEPFVQIPQDKITAALITILDRRNHPILIHCNKGKHRTGCLIGCLRKLQQWSLTTIFDEYRRFSFPKSRSMDQEFIELYSERVVWLQVDRFWLPRWSVLGKNGRVEQGGGSASSFSGRFDDEDFQQQEGQDQRGAWAADSNHSSSNNNSLALTAETIHRLKLKGM